MVGATGGGPRGKPTGAISDAGIIGSGLFATKSIACAITGSARSLIKLNLASDIIEETEESGSCMESMLRKRLDMLKKSGETAGGIVLHSSGCAGVYFTAPCMPYAVVKNECIVYGWNMGDRHYRKYPNGEEKIICLCEIQIPEVF